MEGVLDQSFPSQVETIEKQQENRYRQAIQDNPFDFESWMELVKHVESYVSAKQKTPALNIEMYRQILQDYPLCYGYWRKLADIYAVQNEESKVVEIYEEALGYLPICVEIWTAYCGWMATKKTEQESRELFERAANACGKVYNSTLFWDKYLEFERNNKQYERIGQLFWRLLQFPTSKLHDYCKRYPLISFRNFIEARGRQMSHYGAQLPPYPQAEEVPIDDSQHGTKLEMLYSARCEANKQSRIREILDAYENTIKEYNLRRQFEQKIKRHFFHAKALDEAQLQNWREYLQFQENYGGVDDMILLYERCIVACCYYPEFWTRYAHFLLQVKGEEEARGLFDRANKHFLKRRHWGFLAQGEFAEFLGKFDEAKQLYAYVYNEMGKVYTAPGLLEAIFRHLSLEHRQGNESQVESLYEKAFEIAKSSQKEALISFVANHYTRYLHFIRSDYERALNILDSTLQQIKRQKSLYLSYIQTAQMLEDPSRKQNLIREAYEKALQHLQHNERSEIWLIYLSWMRDSWENLQEVYDLEERFHREFPNSPLYPSCYNLEAHTGKPYKRFKSSQQIHQTPYQLSCGAAGSCFSSSPRRPCWLLRRAQSNTKSYWQFSRKNRSLNMRFKQLQSGRSSNLRARVQLRQVANSGGKFRHRASIGVAILRSLILSYRSLLLFALRPCQGREPLRKYMKTCPKPSRSSLRDCSIPRCVLIDAYLAVPVKFFPSLHGICYCVRGSLYFLASPKSIMCTQFDRLPIPSKKLSGLISLCRKFLAWRNSTRDIVQSAIIRTVLRLKRRLQQLNKSSSEGPNKSITITLYSASTPYQWMFGIPTPPYRMRYNLLSYRSYGCLVRTGSILMATSSLVQILVPKKISPKEPLPIERPLRYFPPKRISLEGC